MSAPEPEWLLVPEVAQRARCGKGEVLAALADGSLHGHQRVANGRWRVHRDAVDSWVAGAVHKCRWCHTAVRRAS